MGRVLLTGNGIAVSTHNIGNLTLLHEHVLAHARYIDALLIRVADFRRFDIARVLALRPSHDLYAS